MHGSYYNIPSNVTIIIVLPEPTMTKENLKQVILTVSPSKRESLWKMWIPPARMKAIEQSTLEDDQMECFVQYIVTYTPYAVWSEISQRLYEKGERAALEIARSFLQPSSNGGIEPLKLITSLRL